MIKLDTMKLHIGLKAGKTLSDFAAEQGVTEDQFVDWLKKTFYDERIQKDFLGRMERNRKKNLRIRKGKTKVDHGVAAEEGLEPVENTEEVESEADSASVDEPEPDPKEIISEAIKILRDELNSVELHHKELCSERNEIRNTLVTNQGKLQEMVDIVDSFQKDVKRLEGEVDRTSDEMVEANHKIHDLREQLSQKEAELEELQKKTILVLDSGELEDEENNTVEVSEWEALRDSLRQDEDFEDLTGKQIKALAKAITLKNAEPKVEFIFESVELEIAYELSQEVKA